MRRFAPAIVPAFAALIGLPLFTLSAQQTTSGNATRGHDWTQFGWDLARTSVSTAPTGINATNVKTMVRQQVTLDGTVDASPIY